MKMAPRETQISRQAKRLSAGLIDRRRFVMQALATGVSMPTALSLASRAEAAQPRRGGTLRFGASSAESRQAHLLEACRDRLFELDQNGTPLPSLAADFEAREDGRVWVIDLTQDVSFHSGRPLTSQDVAWSLENTLGTAPHRRIKAVRAIDTHRVEIELHVPHKDFPAVLSEVTATISPAPQTDETANTFDGTGAYRFETAETGVHLVRNSSDWRADRGYFDRVALYVFDDAQTRQSAIMNDDVDVVDDLDPRGLAMLAHIDDVSVVETQGTHHLRIEFPTEGPFGDQSLRAAFFQSIGWAGLLERVFLGHGAVGQDVTELFGAMGRSDTAREPGRLDEHSTSLSLTISDPASRTLASCAEDMVMSASRAGLKLDLGIDNPMAARVSIQGNAADTLPHGKGTLAETFRPDSRVFVPLWLNDVSAHRSKLTGPQSETRPFITKWWFKAPV